MPGILQSRFWTPGIAFVGYASASATTVTLPGGYQAGDVALPHAFRSTAATIPTLPSGNLSIGSNAANTCAFIWTWRVLLASTGLTSGTFTGATQLQYPIYRGVKGWAAKGQNQGASTSMNYPAVTAGAANGTAWWCAAGAHRTANNVNGAISGLTNRGSIGSGPMAALFDSNGVKSGNWSSTSLTVSANSGWNTEIGELTDYSTWLNYVSADYAISSDGKTATRSGATARIAVLSYPRNDKRVFDFIFTGTSAYPSFGIVDSSQGPIQVDGVTDAFVKGVQIAQNGATNELWINDVLITTNFVPFAVNGTPQRIRFVSDAAGQQIWIKNVTAAGDWNGNPSANPDTSVGGQSFSVLASGYLWPALGLDSGDVVQFDGNPAHGLTTAQSWDV